MVAKLWKQLCRLFLVLLFLVAVNPTYASSDPNQDWLEIRSPHFIVISNAGEREGRHAAAQFEHIRALFQFAFPRLRVDSGKPTILFALKDEESLKLFLPSYGLNKKEKRLAGLYHPGAEKNFALVRTDLTASGNNGYHALYHEYTHSLLQINFRGLPLWLEEGLAEFYGNSIFEEKQVIVGVVDPNELRTLQERPLIPIQKLLTVDHASPLYNTQEHSGIFYAESWALVHYFSFAPEVREKNLLNKFMAILRATDDPIEAANESFGDLNGVADKLATYSRQVGFLEAKWPLQAKSTQKDFEVRRLEPAEILVQQADFLLSTGHREDALNALHQAEAQNPKLPAVHDGLGDYHYLNSAFEEACREFDKALAFDPNDATALFLKANSLFRESGHTKETLPQIRQYLEKTVELAPDLAPAHALLSVVYLEAAETRSKAIMEANRAADLEPGNLAYFVDLGKAFLANGRIEEAKRVSEHAQKVAITSLDRAIASSFASQLTGRNMVQTPSP